MRHPVSYVNEPALIGRDNNIHFIIIRPDVLLTSSSASSSASPAPCAFPNLLRLGLRKTQRREARCLLLSHCAYSFCSLSTFFNLNITRIWIGFRRLLLPALSIHKKGLVTQYEKTSSHDILNGQELNQFWHRIPWISVHRNLVGYHGQ